MPFVKLEGAGNDFVLIDATADSDGDTPNLAKIDWPSLAPWLCDRHFGIGADGILLLLPSARADIQMIVINSDGSVAEMCGNGIRCVARYWHDTGRMRASMLRVETAAGILTPTFGADRQIRVPMGVPRLNRHEIPMIGPPGQPVVSEFFPELGLAISAVSMGNPHAVAFVADLDQLSFETLGPQLSCSERFPQGANASFAQRLGPHTIRLKVWERGVGPTLACGTAACAAVVAGTLENRLDHKANVLLPGGALLIEWVADGMVYMT
ncbi:MAG: diaminopimelate epimerase, partial [Cyanobacteria bacterium NC_groundwater_1444_Ag_S-0.65um_54_12]|nr:diaminopimelate epimerase [Cyanobacteria bacterium NC_groundwater_1444_Ag_S-0.65um_54_12]